MKDEFNINDNISSEKVRLIDQNGNFQGILSKNDALNKAINRDLDLVEFNVGKDGISVCKIMDYGKLRYSMIKKKKSIKNSANNVIKIKEMRISYNISDHDLSIKNKKVKKFIDKRYKINYIMELKGREKNIVDDAIKKMKDCIADFSDISVCSDLDISYSSKNVRIHTSISPK